MATQILDQLMKQAETLSVDEQLRLATYLVELVRKTQPPAGARPKWRDIRGKARPSMFGEDAQAWVSRTRRESDDARLKGVIE